jgi:translation initiation factor 2 alpha subunit (eIF-2alpha)
MWVILAFMIFRELGLGSLLKSVQEGQQKSNASKESLTEKVVTQVLEQYGELTAAVEKLTDRIEALTEETKASRSGNLPLVAGNSRNGSSL